MLLARVSFTPHIDHEEAELVAVADAYLESLLKNGQICGDYVKGWSEGILQAYVRISHRSAAQNRYLSQWGQRHLTDVRLQFGDEPEWEILDDDVSLRVPTWKSAGSLYLFSHTLSVDSPVRHGDRGTSLALPLLPLTDRLREDIHFWKRAYALQDGLWLDGETMEMEAYAQLSQPDSPLAAMGRRICSEVETATKKPVYYYLVRHWGSHEREIEKRLPCPGCGQPWIRQDSPMPSREPFQKFHFQCESCRLVSHAATAFDRPEFVPEAGQ